MLSSTTFGSTMISFTSSGCALYKMLMIKVLMQTDLPEPVAPAISMWGILAMSDTTAFPAMSLPTAKAILEGKSWNSLLSRRSRSATAMVSLLGTSMPIAAFPGIGASIRMSVAARCILISSDSPTIFETFTPCSGCSS